MNIAKAQKKISRLKGEVASLKGRIGNAVSFLKGSSHEDLEPLMRDYHEKVKQLIELKNAVMQKNVEKGMFSTILRVGELKAEISLLEALQIKSGPEAHFGSSLEYETQMGENQRQEMIAKLQSSVEEMIDSLDEFNASTTL